MACVPLGDEIAVSGLDCSKRDGATDRDKGDEEAKSSSEEGKASSEEEEEPECTPMHLIPAYPFPADFQVSSGSSHLNVCQHLCRRHPEGTRAIIIFFPGVHGGVGPCRQPGNNFDENALYPTLARSLADTYDVDCYRCSWTHMRPRMREAVGGACQVLHNGLTEVMKAAPAIAEEKELKVLVFGHSLGGAVAVNFSLVIANYFGSDGRGGQHMKGIERVRVHLAGLCTLNGAMSVDSDDASDRFDTLRETRALFVAGDADDVVEPSATEGLFNAMPMERKKHVVCPGGTHDLFAHKQQLLAELTSFVAATFE